jgi:hypothetical protein
MSNAKPIFDTIRLLPRDHAFLTRRVGSVGEIYLDRIDNSIRIFDGETAGGFSLLKADLSNIQGGGGGGSGEVSFGNRTLVASGFRGNLTGTVSDLSNRALNDLGDVVLTSAVNGQYLTYDGTRWINTNLTINLDSLGEENIAVTGLTLRNRGVLQLNDFDNTNFISLRAPATVPVNYVLTLPPSDGTSGQFLSTNGLGVLSWASAAGGGPNAATPPGGQNKQIQYNNNGAFGGSSTFAYDDTTDIVSATNFTATGRFNGTLYGDVNSTGISSFSGVTVTGGNIDSTPIGATTKAAGGFTTLTANNSVTFTSTSNSTTHENGTLVVRGGIGVALDVRIGGDLYVAGITTSQDIISNSNVVVPRLPTLVTHAANKRYVDTRSIAISVALS